MIDIRYSIVEVDLSAAGPAIRSVWVKNFPAYDSESAAAKLQLGYVNNPAGSGSVLVLNAEGLPDMQGTLGLHPRVFHLGSRSIRATGLADFAVNAEHRSLGPAMMLMRSGARLAADRFDLTYAFPNDKAAPVFAATGFKLLGAVQRYAFLLTTRERLAKRLPHTLTLCLAPVVDRVLYFLDWTRNLRASAKLACLPANWNDAAFDEIWARRPAATLLSERSGRMLNWRFAASGRRSWQACVARDSAGIARGYVVWRSANGSIEIGDFFADDPQRWTTALLLAFIRHARRMRFGSISVEFFGSAAVGAGLRRAGLVLRPEHYPVFLNKTNRFEVEPAQLWHLTSFDNDAD
jgi:hypothetical protein